MAAAPWCRRHTSCSCTRLSRCRVCPCSSRTVVVLARRGRRFHSLAPPLVQLAEGSAIRSGWIGAATASRTLLRGHALCRGSVGPDERRGGGSCCDVGKKRALSSSSRDATSRG